MRTVNKPLPPSIAYFNMYMMLHGQDSGVYIRIALSLN